MLICLLFNISNLHGQSNEELASQILIQRTEYGVPHISSKTLKGAAFGLAWCELEDYGERVIKPLVAARGDLALIDGYDAIENDFARQESYQWMREKYSSLSHETRELLEGFAEGVNYYLTKNPQKFPQYKGWQFSGHDVAAVTTSILNAQNGQGFIRSLKERRARQDTLKLTEAGSNAWAFSPSRTKNGNAILVRNPHLSWSAGYYEAHLKVEGVLDFYGDFRIGGLFAIIGGFNEYLGWATTNNNPDLEEVYVFEADSNKMDHYILDGISIPLERKLVSAEFKNGNSLSSETKEFFYTPYGPVINREGGAVYVLRQAGDKEYRRGEQFTRMLLSKNLKEWKDAMRMQAITSSNYTYADRDGNIFYIWNAGTPQLMHPSGGDTAVIKVQKSEQIWNKYVPFDDLPQLLNPPGGYLHNENDPFHFTNLNKILKPEDYPSNFPKPRLRQRSQHSLSLIHNDDKLSLKDVVTRKHSMKMLLADQIKDDLLKILDKANDGNLNEVIKHLKKWNNSVEAKSKGGILFQEWFETYARLMKGQELYAVPWDFDQPMTTPDGIGDHQVALEAMHLAVENIIEKYKTYDLAWGEIHRMRIGEIDLPVSGGPGGLGCFRVLWFTTDEDGKRKIRGGDGWQLAVEFSNPPSAYSILAYGQSNNPDSPYHIAQAELFANNKMKKVAYTNKEITSKLIKSYRPGN